MIILKRVINLLRILLKALSLYLDKKYLELSGISIPSFFPQSFKIAEIAAMVLSIKDGSFLYYSIIL